jgi:two-component system sensor histidine kinase UhpB
MSLRFLRGRSLTARVFVAGAAVLALILLLLIVTPITIHAPPRPDELVILVLGFLAMLVIQLALARRVLAPLRELTSQMQEIDLREPREQLREGDEPAAEIRAVIKAFNAMLDRLSAERRQSARIALGAQEAERLRIARELHDDLGQALTAVALQVERLARSSSGGEAKQLNELAKQLHAGLDDLHRIARELRPEALDDLGLINALIALTSRLDRQSDLRVERHLASDLPPLSAEEELVIYRVAQEALTNVVRHADASTARLTLSHTNGSALLVISDDGRGISANRDGNGSGIQGMRERAMLVGGALRIEPLPSGGTEVRLTVPLEGRP